MRARLAASALLVLIVFLVHAFIVYALFLPTRERDPCASQPCDTTTEYFRTVYGRESGAQVQRSTWSQHNFFWDSASDELRKNSPVATNLSLAWPPPRGSRSRLTAFPYPPDSTSSFWLMNFARGMKSLLDNTRGSITFPGWLVSVYDPTDPNDNPYGRAMHDMGLTRTQLRGADDASCTEQWMEVIHACYPPPGQEYPYCDDGGYWLYMTPGTGVYWGTGQRWLVANNKIDALYRMLDTPVGDRIMNAEGFKKPTDFLASKLEGTGGGLNLLAAMRNVIDAMQSHQRVPTITAFRNMDGGDSRPTWFLFCVYWCGTVVAVATGVALTVRAALRKLWRRSAALGVGTAAGSLLLGAFGWYVVTERALRGFGYVTLDQALAKSSAGSIHALLERAANGRDMVANGLCMVQNFDLLLEQLAMGLKLTSVIMHAQPNKSGSWAVEIMDMRALLNADSVSDELTLLDLGLCGTSANVVKTDFQQGYRPQQGAFLGYAPSGERCDCDEHRVKQYLQRTGTVAKCTFCSGHISEKLCMP